MIKKRHSKLTTEEMDSLIGHTKMIKVDGVLAKLETENLTGSVKDRMAWYITRKAEERGEIKPGGKILELTSGNTGIAFSMISAIRGYKFTAVMPASVSVERRKMLKLLGANLVLTPAKQDMIGALKKYNELVKKNPNAWLPRQFENRDNIFENERFLGREIIEQTDGYIDAFVAGVGTGGTLIGVGLALKKLNPKIKIVAVEPAESAVLSGKKPGHHGIEGIGEGFIPKIAQEHRYLIDEVIAIKTNDAIKAAEMLAREYGLLVGISSGANFLAAKQLKKKYKRVVTVFPDRAERYLSVFK